MAMSLLLIATLCAADDPLALPHAMPVKIAGPWTVVLGPGSVETERGVLTLAEPVTVEIPPPVSVRIENEKHDALPVFNPQTGGWIKGAKLARLVAEECTATGLLDPASVRVKPESGDAELFVLDKDYALDPFWATFGRIDGGTIPEGKPVFVDYVYTPCRLDTIVLDAKGQVRLVTGAPGIGAIEPPALAEGETALANVWLPGAVAQLSGENLYPIAYESAPPQTPSQAERCLPKTLAKLRAGEPVTVVAWGDSVTNGGAVKPESLWYQHVFQQRLQARFPQSIVTLRTAAWGGGNSQGYMSAPPGGQYDFVRDVLDPKPDLVTIEFVNDAYFDEQGVRDHYGKIMSILGGIGAEVILITPHYVRPDWLHVDTLKTSDDPRPYVKGLRLFAAEQGIALADASADWGALWRQGIPYTTLLNNGINHPDARGHEIFARRLMEVFPEK
ncbi:MAG: hypothetical protein QG656_2516 [Candidatus Hydrogenedentes bacterium]|nr:hypothetical protein [Candidatus Hydrogenedentota bacterium]